MSADLLDHLLRGTLPDPDSSGMLSVPTKSVVIAPSLRNAAIDLVTNIGFGKKLLVVSDATTHEILGSRVVSELASAFTVDELVFSKSPYADLQTVEQIEARQASGMANALIAVGSGTINDLCKYAAHRQRVPYAVFATAPSMNGYSSVSAAVSVHGHKKSLPATAANGIFADLGILAKAPTRMIRSGFGDSISRSTSQTDWLFTHLLLDQPYRQAPFILLEEDERELLLKPERLIQGDMKAVELLMRNLTLSGFGMTIAGSSQPASQGEHLISHYLEMMPPENWSPAFHGEQVAVATITMARLQEKMLEDTAPLLRPTEIEEKDLVAHFGGDLGHSCWQGFSKKRLDADQANHLTQRLQRDWPAIRSRLNAIRRSAKEIKAALKRVDAPVKPEDIGLTDKQYKQAVLHAREIRDRFTFLDLAADSGFLTSFIAALDHADSTSGAESIVLQ